MLVPALFPRAEIQKQLCPSVDEETQRKCSSLKGEGNPVLWENADETQNILPREERQK